MTTSNFGCVVKISKLTDESTNRYFTNTGLTIFTFWLKMKVHPKKYARNSCFGVLWCGLVLADFTRVLKDYVHYNDVIMSTMASQLTGVPIVCSRRRSKETSKLRVTGLCAGNSPVTGEFPAQKASNAENVSIWWRRHEPRIITVNRSHGFIPQKIKMQTKRSTKYPVHICENVSRWKGKLKHLHECKSDISNRATNDDFSSYLRKVKGNLVNWSKLDSGTQIKCNQVHETIAKYRRRNDMII